MTVIAFMGRVKSGKDTACAILKEEFGATTMAFADPLKAACHEVFNKAFGVPASAFLGSQDEKNVGLQSYGLPTWTGRTILQFIGTEGFRHIHPEVWSLYAAARIREYQEFYAQYPEANKAMIALSDARFQSEVDVLHRLGGVVVRLTRNPTGATNVGIAGHASELEMDSVVPDYIIDNANNTIPEFKAQVIELARSLHEQAN